MRRFRPRCAETRMRPFTTRRSFLRTAAALAVPGFGPSQGARTPRISLPTPLPHIDGAFLVTEEILRAASDDFGHGVGRVPLAVLRPGSIADLARVVRYANRHGLGVAMRGRGHCVYGQAQVDRGIVIDSSALKGMRWDGRDVTVEAGALWDDVARETLAKGRIPPVMPQMVLLTVGGTLSVGGIGEMSFRSGAQVDQVVSLDVVTGTGELVSCSASRNAELFQMTLAGMGQCALIGRARLRLTAAPSEIQVARLQVRQRPRSPQRRRGACQRRRCRYDRCGVDQEQRRLESGTVDRAICPNGQR